MIKEEYILKFIQNISVGHENGCWEWSGHLSPQNYGIIFIDQKGARAHRFSLHFFRGTNLWQKDHHDHVDHLCRNTRCVNPNHLEQVSARVNVGRSRALSTINREKTHCINGHPFEGRNLIIVKGKYGQNRQCRKCNLTRNRSWYKKEFNTRFPWKTKEFRKKLHDFYDVLSIPYDDIALFFGIKRDSVKHFVMKHRRDNGIRIYKTKGGNV